MIPIKKKYVSQVLILCILSLMFHSHLHFHHFQENTNALVIPIVDKDPHFSQECNQCLNDINKIETQLKKTKVFQNSPLFPKIQVQYNAYITFDYKLYSRPPPILAT